MVCQQIPVYNDRTNQTWEIKMNTNTKTAHQRRASIIDDLILSMEQAQDKHADIHQRVMKDVATMRRTRPQIGVWRPGC